MTICQIAMIMWILYSSWSRQVVDPRVQGNVAIPRQVWQGGKGGTCVALASWLLYVCMIMSWGYDQYNSASHTLHHEIIGCQNIGHSLKMLSSWTHRIIYNHNFIIFSKCSWLSQPVNFKCCILGFCLIMKWVDSVAHYHSQDSL